MESDVLKKRALIVDDEVKITQVVKSYLEKSGFEVGVSYDGLDAIKRSTGEDWDIIILDRMLPEVEGEAVFKIIRQKKDTPIIMLTAKTSEKDRLEGFELGADDYVPKPFSPRELVARVKAVLKRIPEKDSRGIVIDSGRITIDPDKMELYKDKVKIDLTPLEFNLVHLMARSPGIVFTREKLIQEIFGYDYEGYDRTIDVHIKNIRKKIEDRADKPVYIKTVYSVGYKFENPAK